MISFQTRRSEGSFFLFFFTLCALKTCFSSSYSDERTAPPAWPCSALRTWQRKGSLATLTWTLPAIFVLLVGPFFNFKLRFQTKFDCPPSSLKFVDSAANRLECTDAPFLEESAALEDILNTKFSVCVTCLLFYSFTSLLFDNRSVAPPLCELFLTIALHRRRFDPWKILFVFLFTACVCVSVWTSDSCAFVFKRAHHTCVPIGRTVSLVCVFLKKNFFNQFFISFRLIFPIWITSIINFSSSVCACDSWFEDLCLCSTDLFSIPNRTLCASLRWVNVLGAQQPRALLRLLC